MKLITAYIQPDKLSDVKQALANVDIKKISVITNALGAGLEKGYTDSYRGVQVQVNLRMKVRLEVAVNEDFVEPCIQAIIAGAQTGKVGDGKIFVTELVECIRIRNGERGSAAIG